VDHGLNMDHGHDAWGHGCLAMMHGAMQVGHGPWHGGPHIKLGNLFCWFNIVNSHWNSLARRATWA